MFMNFISIMLYRKTLHMFDRLKVKFGSCVKMACNCSSIKPCTPCGMCSGMGGLSTFKRNENVRELKTLKSFKKIKISLSSFEFLQLLMSLTMFVDLNVDLSSKIHQDPEIVRFMLKKLSGNQILIIQES